MTSILKADNIQDADGNNIINESGNTITIGASGDTINVPSGATFNINGTAGTGLGTNTPAFFVNKHSSSNQDISNNTATKITFDSESWDVGSGFDLSNDKFVVPSGEGGKYHINFTCRTYDAGGELYSVRQQIYKNGGRVSNNEFYGGADGEFEMEGTCFTHIVELDLSASDYLECYMTCKTHDSSNITILGDSSNFKTYFSGFKLIGV